MSTDVEASLGHATSVALVKSMQPDISTSHRLIATLAVIALTAGATAAAATAAGAVGLRRPSREVPPEDFVTLLVAGGDAQQAALDRIESQWHPGFVPMLLEVLQLSRDRGLVSHLIGLLQEKTGQDLGWSIDGWSEWLWSREERVDYPRYAEFKSELYRRLDPKFATYFANDRPSSIRLDEVRWGGVRQDGIPPLRRPKMLAASDARYLDPSNVVFGIEVNGDARAYPKRILAWHEMFVDEVGGIEVAGVYCTLCGTVILYETEVDGVRHEVGTSGFLYRSNKLMYDRATQSLWNTLWGQPVIGPLANRDIQLTRRSVVTTTWGEWLRRHPDTTVLSLDTGHQRDYSEGAAYRDYFATDELMFTVPELDRRLQNKDEVLALLVPEHPDRPLAIWTGFLTQNKLHHDRIGEVELVVLTDRSGASRVYETRGRRFTGWDRDARAVDSDGTVWTLSESALRSAEGELLRRLPAHRAFWFGWYGAYSHTRLVK